MTTQYDVAAIGNAIVDVIASSDDAFLAAQGLVKGSMALIDADQAEHLYGRMAQAIETSGGSAGNTVAGVASLGGQAAYIGKVADDQLGAFFAHDLKAIGAHFSSTPLVGGAPTARSLINVTPDGERTMCTYLGACVELTAADVDPAIIENAFSVYLEGYLFDPPEARRAFAKAAGLAHGAGRLIAMTLSDSFVVERHREGLLAFIDSQVDIVFANSDEVKALFQTDDFDNAAAQLGARTKIAAVTNGAQGSIVLAGRDSHRIDACPVDKVVDTTGAGDQYAAGFLFGLARGRSLEVCGRLGSMAAAEVISHIGPRPQVNLAELARTQGLI
ncbi:sugar/nucleoside kinase (ribokinase family) [Caulobacter ginsengisoli]|uniref:Sugar/nucleoside kinase (Ribokinase family) n=1 Tax=Caulobacter ginsengisoli TaxID=400775 RepID=A0ABU0IVU6_9CAUL|nr:adenosine kinase [Caulobacter ginsengisoli]MDQ0465268.1 sugar/nucleoside kinase (ribokinase family) [Caulobacter ginsengisoli]